MAWRPPLDFWAVDLAMLKQFQGERFDSLPIRPQQPYRPLPTLLNESAGGYVIRIPLEGHASCSVKMHGKTVRSELSSAESSTATCLAKDDRPRSDMTRGEWRGNGRFINTITAGNL